MSENVKNSPPKQFLRIKGGVVVGVAISPVPRHDLTQDDEWRECDAEVLAHFNAGMLVKPAPDGVRFEVTPQPPEVRAQVHRMRRNFMLLHTDQYDTASAEARLGPELFAKWQVYRQELRDLPLQPGFPDAFRWPVRPDQEQPVEEA